MASKKITKTWWGEKWLDALNGVYLTNRIGRGKTYANTGRVYDILINDNLALAKVRGNYQSFYNVSVEFKQFSQKEKNIIIRTIYENPSIMSALLNHKLPNELYQILLDEGYINGFQVIENGNQGIIQISLKYGPNKTQVITGLRRVSKPGLRIYSDVENMPKVMKGLGIAILSTSKGIMTDKQARKANVGGEVLAFVW